MLVAVNFHYIRDDFDAPYASIFGVTPEQFRSQLLILGKTGDFVGSDDIVAALDGRKPLPERAIAVTFDDGLAEQFAAAWPILQEMGIPAIFFPNTACIASATVETVHKIHILRSQIAPADILAVLAEYADSHDIDLAKFDTTNARLQYKYDTAENAELKYLLNFVLTASQQAELVDRALATLTDFDEAAVSRRLYMNPEQVLALDRAGALGSHGHRHFMLGALPPAEINAQIRDSMQVFRDWGCRRLQSFSYPYGSREACPPAAAAVAADCGLRFAFTTERAANPDLQCPMYLARFACNDLPGGSNPGWSAETMFERMPLSQWQR